MEMSQIPNEFAAAYQLEIERGGEKEAVKFDRDEERESAKHMVQICFTMYC